MGGEVTLLAGAEKTSAKAIVKIALPGKSAEQVRGR
jgi:hypothetical protein